MEPKNFDVTSQSYVNTLIHFYRGELGRMMSWRQRFDATTNWAVILTGSLFAFAFHTPTFINPTMLLSLFVLGFFAVLEARRFMFYDAFRARVRMLEIHFIAPTLLDYDANLLEGDWRQQLAHDLLNPSFKCSFLFALGRRLRRTYFALHLFVLIGWNGLMLVTSPTGPASFSGWINRFRLEFVPGPLFAGLILGYYVFLLVLVVHSTGLQHRHGELDRRLRGTPGWDYGA